MPTIANLECAAYVTKLVRDAESDAKTEYRNALGDEVLARADYASRYTAANRFIGYFQGPMANANLGYANIVEPAIAKREGGERRLAALSTAAQLAFNNVVLGLRTKDLGECTPGQLGALQARGQVKAIGELAATVGPPSDDFIKIYLADAMAAAAQRNPSASE
jgi:hypothetical protein